MKIIMIHPFYVGPKLHSFLKEQVPDDVDVTGVGPEGPHGEGSSDIARTAPYVVDAVIDAEKKGYDAIILGGNPDPLVHEARELVDIPVVGRGMIITHIAFILAHRLCIFAPSLLVLRWMYQNVVKRYGFEAKTVLKNQNNKDAWQQFEEYLKYKESGGKITPFINELVEMSIKAIEEDDVGAITFACTGTSWVSDVLQKELRDRGYGAIVINPIRTGIEITRALVNLKLTHSRITYPKMVHRELARADR